MSGVDTAATADAASGPLRRLRRLVELESPSGDESRIRALASEFAGDLARLGATIETRDVEGVGVHVIGRMEGSEPHLAPIMVLGHLDTVHPVGSFEPVFHVADGRARGPGAFDMKGGWACMLEALDRTRGAGRRRPLLILATCDEETGSGTSRDLITDLSRNARAVLVPEPPFPGGGAKTGRKGVGWYRVTVRGRASHAGLEPEQGVNAVLELAHQVLAVSSLQDHEAGTTVSVDLARGGTASNVIPAVAWAEVDVRFNSMAEARRVDSGLRGLAPVLAGARLEVDGGINRPPMVRTAAGAELYERARRLAEEAGWLLGEGHSGGASDGSLTAAQGVPTLDGIGPVGGGAHAADEHVIVDDLPRRVQLYGRLLETL